MENCVNNYKQVLAVGGVSEQEVVKRELEKLQSWHGRVGIGSLPEFRSRLHIRIIEVAEPLERKEESRNVHYNIGSYCQLNHCCMVQVDAKEVEE